MVKIISVEKGSIAEECGLRGGDVLISINDNEINDVLDYRFYLTECEVVLSVERDGERFEVEIEKDEYDDIGLSFETPLMDKKHSCRNKCIFCFIDQLPEGMRESLYFKDDDSRLSFLHGNYITLTNLGDADIDRIIKMHISPVNISVHTTNPALRVEMMKNKRAGEVLSYLKRLADANIAISAQIVLCRGVNDGDELIRSMNDLAELYPALRSVSVVPAGLTKFRDELYPLSPYSDAESAEIIRTVEDFSEKCLKKYGTRLFFAADELYLKAGLPIPSDEHYEEYYQIENGVGMLRSLYSEFELELEYLEDYLESYSAPRRVSIATGAAAYDWMVSLSEALMNKVEGLEVKVYKIINNYFGESITVSGLLTGRDMAEQLMGKDLCDELLIPVNTLKADEDIFLCGMTPGELSEKLGVRVRASKNDGADLICDLLGVEKPTF